MRRRSIRSCIVVVVATLVLIAPLARAFAAPDADDLQDGPDEYGVKAGFLCHFAQFVTWPNRKFTEPDSPLIIGVVGGDPFGGRLDKAAQHKRINDRSITILHIENMEELRKCHILFICRSETSRLGSILSEVRGENVLTVGESDNFISRGGIINFVMVGNKVHFEINGNAARRAGLKIRSTLQQLAIPSSH